MRMYFASHELELSMGPMESVLAAFETEAKASADSSVFKYVTRSVHMRDVIAFKDATLVSTRQCGISDFLEVCTHMASFPIGLIFPLNDV